MTSTDTVVDLHEARLRRAGLHRAARYHHDPNEYRAARRQQKADALRVLLKDNADTLDIDAGTVDGLHTLAAFVRRHKADEALWAKLAYAAGVSPPGASYSPARGDLPADRYRTVYLVADDLDLDAADLAVELADG